MIAIDIIDSDSGIMEVLLDMIDDELIKSIDSLKFHWHHEWVSESVTSSIYSTGMHPTCTND